MDWVLDVADHLFLDKAWAHLVPISAFIPPQHPLLNATSQTTYASLVSHLPHPPLPPLSLASMAESAWPRSYVPRQMLSLISITLVGIHLLYFIFASLSYYFIFNHEMMKHPRFLKNQIKLEIQTSVSAFPGMMLLTLPWFQGEVMGYSRIYTKWDEYGYFYLFFSIPFFLLFTDYCIYWIHRWLHIPWLYKRLHKPHHKWIVPTPFASHAFHPVDGYFQSIPYHLFVFIFPLQRFVYLGLFIFVNFWTILIHDSDMITDHPLEHVINGPAHHTLHHIYFNCNYGQYFTWADRAGSSYRHPSKDQDPLLEVKALENSKAGKNE